jgi:hypothetical protein
METIALLPNAVSDRFHYFNVCEDTISNLETVSLFLLSLLIKLIVTLTIVKVINMLWMNVL